MDKNQYPDDPLLTSLEGSARVLTLNRPQAMNAIDPGLLAAMHRALDAAEADATLTALVFSAQGKAFCAGADLKAARARAEGSDTEAESARFITQVGALMRRIEQFPRPVIAAVQGLALAGGLELVLCCDLVIAARSARFGDAHANYGLLPGAGGSARLPRKIGPARAKYLMYTGEFLAAEQVLPWGLVNEVVDDGALMVAVRRLIDQLASKSPLGLQRMKRLVDDGLELSLDDALANEQAVSAQHAASFDRKEGLAAFAQGRAPHFIGR